MPRKTAGDEAAPAKDQRLARAIKESKAPAISRAAAILRLLGKTDTPLGLQAIARELDLVPSTCLYALRALVEEELVAFDDDAKRYSLDAGVLTLARQWLQRDQFSDLAQPVLDRISREHGVTMLAVQSTGTDHIVVVCASRAANSLQVSAQVGGRFPALISATGRCIAAFGDYSDAELTRKFHELRWDNPPTLKEWKEQVEETRERGFALDSGNYIAGVTVLAVPVWVTPGKFSHALVALGLGSALQRGGLEDLCEDLLAAAEGLSARLGAG